MLKKCSIFAALVGFYISSYGKLPLFALSSLCLSVLFSGFPSMEEEEEEEEEALTGEKEKRQIMERA